MSVQKLHDKSKIYSQKMPYTQVSNYVVENITDMEAGFVWIYLLSKSSNWKVIKEHIKNHFKIGDRKIKHIFSYLHKHNLIKYHQIRTECGTKISHIDIEVLNGQEFIKDDEISTGSEMNPVHNDPGTECRTTKQRINTKQKIKNETIEIPSWLSKEKWEEFCEHRKLIKKPLNHLSAKKIINKLEKLKNNGQNIYEIMDKSIENHWAGVFEKEKPKTQIQQKPRQETSYASVNNQSTSHVTAEESIARDREYQRIFEQRMKSHGSEKAEIPQGRRNFTSSNIRSNGVRKVENILF